MLYLEKTAEEGYEYVCEDLFGKLTIHSEIKIDGEKLDDLTLLIMKRGKGAEVVTGEVKHDEGIIKYELKRAPTWLDDKEEKRCINTPTETKKQENIKQAINHYLRGVWKIGSWLRRFVEAFREAYRNSK